LTEAAALLLTLAVLVVVVLELSSVFELDDIVGAVKFFEWLAKIGHSNLGADVGNGPCVLVSSIDYRPCSQQQDFQAIQVSLLRQWAFLVVGGR
jgi:hypothetical protein